MKFATRSKTMFTKPLSSITTRFSGVSDTFFRIRTSCCIVATSRAFSAVSDTMVSAMVVDTGEGNSFTSPSTSSSTSHSVNCAWPLTTGNAAQSTSRFSFSVKEGTISGFWMKFFTAFSAMSAISSLTCSDSTCSSDLPAPASISL